MSSKVAVIAFREFIETVRTKAFFLGVVLMPALIVVVIFAAERLERMARQQAVGPRKIAVVDEHGEVFEALNAEIARFNVENPQRVYKLTELPPAESNRDDLVKAVREGDYYAGIFIPADAVAGQAECLMARRDNKLNEGRELTDRINSAVVEVRFRQSDPPLDRERIRALERPVRVGELDPQTGGVRPNDKFARILMPFAFAFLLYIGTFGVSMGLLTSLLEEKGSRVMEVLLAAVSPMQLMAGKILGNAMVGLLVLAVWVGVGYMGARSYNITQALNAANLFYVGLYFIPGFLFMASVLAAVGSACNTLKEAQSMSSPLTIINVVPLMLWLPLSQHPESTLAVSLSYFPPITPFIMVLRISADPDTPWWQIVTTLALLWAAVIATMWAAAKIFRVGVLMYGKPPSIRELLRWVRHA